MKAIILSLSLLICTICNAQQNDIEIIAQKFLNTVQKNAYNSNEIDWQKVNSDFKNKIKNFKTEKDLLPYFQEIIKNLNDKHSSIYYSNNPLEREDDAEDIEVQIKLYSQLKDSQINFPKKNFDSRLVGNKYAYINIPGTMTENEKYVKTIYEQIHNLDQQNPKAWILDLTECSGGATWAVMWNLIPFIEKNKSFYSVSNSKKSEKYQYNIERSKDSNELKVYNLVVKYNNLENYKSLKISNKNKQIVILTSGGTASAGEMLLATLYGQKNVTTIGMRTAGLTSANVPHTISKHYMLNLAETVIKDRKGKVYKIGEGITPDISLNIDLQEYSDKEIKNSVDYYPAVHKAKNEFISEAIKYLNGK